MAIYETYLQRLQARGLLYPCYCSRADIARAASAPHGEEGPRYPGTCRHLTQAQLRRFEAEQRQPSLRFRVEDERTVAFHDLLQGRCEQNVQQAAGDFIARRSDGIFAYQFAVVVDDALMQVQQVVRGADLLASTARRCCSSKRLASPSQTSPTSHSSHTPGQRLSKRAKRGTGTPARRRCNPGANHRPARRKLRPRATAYRASAHALAEQYAGAGYDKMLTALLKPAKPPF